MKLKHKIYKLIDISGLQLFDPIARLLFKEEPKVQIKKNNTVYNYTYTNIFVCSS